MFRISDTVIYCGSQLCVVADIREESFGGAKKSYYILKPVYDKNSTFYQPVESDEAKMRLPISRDCAEKIINGKSETTLEWNGYDPVRKEEFSALLKECNPEKLVAMIRLIQSKRTELVQNGKRLRAADERAFNEAKRTVSEELSYALGTDKDTVLNMIIGN